ncbi:MAG: hypothetical protein ACE5DX_02425 [Candidatus Dojkabacteria bacterium]
MIVRSKPEQPDIHPLQTARGQMETPPESVPAVPSENQMSMELQGSRWEFLYRLKRRLAKISILVEALPYWRNMNTILAFLTSVTIVVALFYSISTNFAKLPDKVPLFFLQSSKSWELVDKEILIPIPIFLAVTLILLNKFSGDVYRFDRRLSFMMNTGIVLFNILGMLAYFQITSLILVF